MKTNKKIKSAGLLLLAAMMLTGINGLDCYGQRNLRHLNSGEFRHAQTRHDHQQSRMTQHLSLDLSEDQKEEMNALKSEHYKTMKPLKNKMHELKAHERTLLSEENVDMKAVEKVIDDQTGLMNKMRKLQVDHQLQAKEILTDEQVMKLEQRRKHSKHRRVNQRKMG